MFEPTVSRRDAASLIFNLPDYRVIDAVDLPGSGRCVEVETISTPGRPTCGVIASRVRTPGDVSGCVTCRSREQWGSSGASAADSATNRCVRGARSSSPRSRSRPGQGPRPGFALRWSKPWSPRGRAASETAWAHGVSWWTVQAALTAAVVMLPDGDAQLVARLGIDEHRYRSVRCFPTPTGGWRRFEPGGTSHLWGRMSTIVDVTTGRVLGGGRRPRLGRGRGLAGSATPGVARRSRSRGDRPLGGVPQGSVRTPARRRGVGGRVLCRRPGYADVVDVCPAQGGARGCEVGTIRGGARRWTLHYRRGAGP